MAAAKKPLPFQTTTRETGIVRGADGRFYRDKAVPEKPVDQEQEGNATPEQWSPKIGQASAATSGPSHEWPEADQPTADGPRVMPMRLR